MLNLRIRKEKISCNLKCNNNYFSTAEIRTSKNYWRGNYQCTSCETKYIAIIRKIEIHNDVIIDLYTKNF